MSQGHCLHSANKYAAESRGGIARHVIRLVLFTGVSLNPAENITDDRPSGFPLSRTTPQNLLVMPSCNRAILPFSSIHALAKALPGRHEQLHTPVELKASQKQEQRPDVRKIDREHPERGKERGHDIRQSVHVQTSKLTSTSEFRVIFSLHRDTPHRIASDTN